MGAKALSKFSCRMADGCRGTCLILICCKIMFLRLFCCVEVHTFNAHSYIVLTIFQTFYTVHGVLMARILQWFAIPSSSGSHFVRTLHGDQFVFCGLV